MHTIHPLNNFLENYPLFTPYKAVEGYIRNAPDYTDPFEFHGLTFSFYCEQERDQKTFELELPESAKKHFGEMPGDKIARELLNDEGILDYVHHFIGRCRSCKGYHVDFLLHIYTDKQIPNNYDNFQKKDPQTGDYVHADSLLPDRANLFIEKLGAPATKIKIEKFIEKYLDRESCGWYYKAKKSLSDNLGIVAFAYLRRIIEKELMAIVRDVSDLEGTDKRMKAVIGRHKASSTPHLVYDDIFEYLPKSLQALGDNPFKMLYKQTSEGLHQLSERECLERSTYIEMIFEFLIKKINEECSELLAVKKAMKSLRMAQTNQNNS